MFAMTVFDDGSGDVLYVGGKSGMARWDGKEWIDIDGETGSSILALAQFDDGTKVNKALYAGGAFKGVGKGFCESNSIARWGKIVAEDCVLTCHYKVKKNSKGKDGCPKDACPQKNEILTTDNLCESKKPDCDKKLKIKKLPCPNGGEGTCTTIKAKRSSCE